MNIEDAKCPHCGASSENLLFWSHVQLPFMVMKNSKGELTVDTVSISNITFDDIVTGIDDDSDTQEISCRKCKATFPAHIEYINKNSDDPEMRIVYNNKENLGDIDTIYKTHLKDIRDNND